MKLFKRRVIGWLARQVSPDFSACGRCGRPWNITVPHDTFYERGTACFPLCEPCWSELTIEERIPYYHELIKKWSRYQIKEVDHTDAIIKAVKAGK